LLFHATKTNNGDTGWELRIIEYLTGTMARPRIQDLKKEEEDSESESQSGYRYIYRQQLANSLVSWDMGGKTEDGIEAGIGPQDLSHVHILICGAQVAIFASNLSVYCSTFYIKFLI